MVTNVSRPGNKQGANSGLLDDAVARIGADLMPLHHDPDITNEGLRAVSPTNGLEELTVQALRGQPPLEGAGPYGEQRQLASAAKRTRSLSADL